MTDPADPAPPPRDTLYLDGRPVGKLVDGKISLTALLQVRGTAFTEKDGVLAFDDLTLRDGEKSPLTGGAVVESGGGQWLVPAETAAGLVNAAVARDRWTGSLFLTSRGRPAKTLWTMAAGAARRTGANSSKTGRTGSKPTGCSSGPPVSGGRR